MQMQVTHQSATAVSVTPLETGICAGTLIMTLDGEIPVEHLTVGDRVVTRDGGVNELKEIRSEKGTLRPILIKAGSLGHTRPDRDILVTLAATVHVRDWRAEALFGSPSADVPAHKLIDGEFVALQSARETVAFELVFDRDQIIYADGVELIAKA